MKSTLNKLKIAALLILSACGSSDEPDYVSAPDRYRTPPTKEGLCNGWDIVGKYTNDDGVNVEFTKHCRLQTPDKFMIVERPDTNTPDFYNPQIVDGTWFQTQEVEQCDIQMVDDEIVFSCFYFEYTGTRVVE